MSRLARHAMIGELVRALREADSWCGRTQIHKTLYGFQKLFNPDPQLRADYVLYKHGPYSFTLDEDLTEMEFYGGLEREEHPPYGPRFAVTSGTDALRDRFGRGVERWIPMLRFAAREVGTKNVRELEALSTIIYVACEESEGLRDASAERHVARVLELKPHLSDAEVRQAHQEFVRLTSEARECVAC